MRPSFIISNLIFTYKEIILTGLTLLQLHKMRKVIKSEINITFTVPQTYSFNNETFYFNFYDN